MTIKARMSRGSKFGVRSAGEENYIYVSDLRTITLPEAVSDQIEVSTLDSSGRVKEYISGATDPGELALEGNYNSEDAGQDAVYSYFKNGETFEWIVEVPSTQQNADPATLSGRAICTICKRIGDITEGELIPFTATLKVSGETVLNA